MVGMTRTNGDILDLMGGPAQQGPREEMGEEEAGPGTVRVHGRTQTDMAEDMAVVEALSMDRKQTHSLGATENSWQKRFELFEKVMPEEIRLGHRGGVNTGLRHLAKSA